MIAKKVVVRFSTNEPDVDRGAAACCRTPRFPLDKILSVEIIVS